MTLGPSQPWWAHQELLFRAPWWTKNLIQGGMHLCLSRGYCTTFIALEWGGKWRHHLGCCLNWVSTMRSNIVPIQTPKGFALCEHRAPSNGSGQGSIHMGLASGAHTPEMLKSFVLCGYCLHMNYTPLPKYYEASLCYLWEWIHVDSLYLTIIMLSLREL